MNRHRSSLSTAAAFGVAALLAGGVIVVGAWTDNNDGGDRLSLATASTTAKATPSQSELHETVRRTAPNGYTGGNVRGEMGAMPFISQAPPRNLSQEEKDRQERETNARLDRQDGGNRSAESERQAPPADVSEAVRAEAARQSKVVAAQEAASPTSIEVIAQLVPAGQSGWTPETLANVGAEPRDTWGADVLAGVVDRQPSYYQVILKKGSVSLMLTVGHPTDQAIAETEAWAGRMLAELP